MAQSDSSMTKGDSWAPLRVPIFRRVWTASLLSNFGQLILGVGAAWEMTRLTTSPSMVALVQTAMMLPLMLVALPAGAFADMFDRRKIAMAGLGFSIVCAIGLSLLAWFGLTTPWILLAFCALIGAGVALYSPAWQASIGEQVGQEQLPAAIALGTISYNVARSFGPALGGLIVLAAGAQAAFAINAFCYIPLFLAYLFWRRKQSPNRLPPERIDRAIISGGRYVLHSRPLRTVLLRAFLFGLAGATASALAPLIARELLGGDASTFGILLGASGVGAVVGAVMVNPIRDRFGTENATRWLAIVGGLALVGVGASRSLSLTCIGLFVAGGASIITIALFNISVQLSAPRWVTARALSLFSSALTGGIGIGALFWGIVASQSSVDVAVIASGLALAALALVAILLPLPQENFAGVEAAIIGHEPEVGLALTMRSGPIIVEIDYRVDPANARDFYDAMRALQRVRMRNGGFNWSLARDIADPALWTERYHCPTWADYLRVRDRFTEADREAQGHADTFLMPDANKQVRRRLERPFGSVRWRADSPDMHQDNIYLAP